MTLIYFLPQFPCALCLDERFFLPCQPPGPRPPVSLPRLVDGLADEVGNQPDDLAVAVWSLRVGKAVGITYLKKAGKSAIM
jgi:hypothetical protein